MTLKGINIVVLAIAILITPFTFGQTNYYVSPAGDDDNSGTDPSSPWQTIQYAIDNADFGDTIFLMDGTYSQPTVYISDKRTTGDDFLVITNYPGQTARIEGTSLTDDPQIFYIENSDNIIIKGLILTNNERNNASAIEVEGFCRNIKILENEISNINFSSDPNDPANSSTNAYPIIVYAYDGDNATTGIVISGNKIHDCRTGYSEGIAVNGNVDGFEISGNLVYNMTNIGIDAIGFEGTAPQNDFARNGVISNNVVHNCVSPYAECGGIYIDGGQYIIVENNISYANQYGIEVGNEHTGTTTANIIVRNNVFYGNQNMGILIGGYRGNVQYVTVTGNTTYANNTGGDWGAELYFSEKCSQITVQNNIFYADNSQNIIVLAEGADTEPDDLDLDYNLYYSANGQSDDNFDWFGDSYDGTLTDFQASGHDLNSFFANPQLIDAPNADFHLTSSSPAINAGNPDFSPAPGETDIDGQPRVIGNRVDIGADEFDGTPTQVQSNRQILVYPNPVDKILVLNGLDAKGQVKIFDVQGKLVLEQKVRDLPAKIDVSALNSGVYFIEAKQNGKSISLGFIKK